MLLKFVLFLYLKKCLQTNLATWFNSENLYTLLPKVLYREYLRHVAHISNRYIWSHYSMLKKWFMRYLSLRATTKMTSTTRVGEFYSNTYVPYVTLAHHPWKEFQNPLLPNGPQWSLFYVHFFILPGLQLQIVSENTWRKH